MPLLHGSQGCATYIRRYMISHFREPLDIASSNFSEETAIFGGRENLRTALENVVRQYCPTPDRHRHDLPGRNHRRRRGHVSP